MNQDIALSSAPSGRGPSVSGLQAPAARARAVPGLRSPVSGVAVVSRLLAAVAGGYTVTALLSLALALLSHAAPREEAIAAGNTPAFLAFAACILWAFVASTAARAWLGIGLPAVALGLLVWRLLP